MDASYEKIACGRFVNRPYEKMKKRTDSKSGKECIKIGKVQNWEGWERLYIVILII